MRKCEIASSSLLETWGIRNSRIYIGPSGHFHPLRARRRFRPSRSPTSPPSPCCHSRTSVVIQKQEYFADGMVEEIIVALSRFRSLFIIARNSTFTYKGQPVSVKQVGRELGVRYVLEGSVRKGGGRVRVTAQLVDAFTGAHLWADRYDRDLTDIFAVEDEITGAVASIIEPALAKAEQDRVLRKAPASLDAWETYQRGLWHFHKYVADENKIAQSFFRRAIEIDANFAPGHYGYAFSQHF